MEFVEEMKARKDALAAAQRKHKEAVKARDKTLKSFDKDIKAAEDELTKPSDSVAGVKLYVDHIAFKGATYSLNQNASAKVDASGSISHVVEKGKKVTHDDRKLFMTVTADEGTFVVDCEPDQENEVRNFAAAICTAGPRAKQNTAELQNKLQELKVKKDEFANDASTLDELQDAIDDAQSDYDDYLASGSDEDRAAFEKNVKSTNRKSILKKVLIGIIVAIVLLCLASTCSQGGSSTSSTGAGANSTSAATSDASSGGSADNSSSVAKTSKEDLQKLAVGASAVFDNYTITLESFTTDGATSTAVVRMDSRSDSSTFAARYVGAYLADGAKVECNETKDSDLKVKKGESQSMTLTFSSAGTVGKVMWNNWGNEAYWIVNADAIAAVDQQKAAEKAAAEEAKAYSGSLYMSYQGIYDQLTSEYGEKFSAEAAQWAMDHLDADYNANALKKAQQYQKTLSMSSSAIYDQLISDYGEKFTADEAQYAIDNLG